MSTQRIDDAACFRDWVETGRALRERLRQRKAHLLHTTEQAERDLRELGVMLEHLDRIVKAE